PYQPRYSIGIMPLKPSDLEQLAQNPRFSKEPRRSFGLVRSPASVPPIVCPALCVRLLWRGSVVCQEETWKRSSYAALFPDSPLALGMCIHLRLESVSCDGPETSIGNKTQSVSCSRGARTSVICSPGLPDACLTLWRACFLKKKNRRERLGVHLHCCFSGQKEACYESIAFHRVWRS